MKSNELEPYKKQFKNSTFCVGEIFFDWVSTLAKMINHENKPKDSDETSEPELLAFVCIYEYYRERTKESIWIGRSYDNSPDHDPRLIILNDMLSDLYPKTFNWNASIATKLCSIQGKGCTEEITKPLISIDPTLIQIAYNRTRGNISECFRKSNINHILDTKDRNYADAPELELNGLIARLANQDDSLFEEAENELKWSVEQDIRFHAIELASIPQQHPSTGEMDELIDLEFDRKMRAFRKSAYAKAGFYTNPQSGGRYSCKREAIIDHIRNIIVKLFREQLSSIPSDSQNSLMLIKTRLGDTSNTARESASALHAFQRQQASGPIPGPIPGPISKPIILQNKKGNIFPSATYLKELGIYRVISAIIADNINKIENGQFAFHQLEQMAYRYTRNYKLNNAPSKTEPLSIYISEDSILSNKRSNLKPKSLPIVESVALRMYNLFDSQQIADAAAWIQYRKSSWKDKSSYKKLYHKFIHIWARKSNFRSMDLDTDPTFD